jgi:phenylalanyl-tRNA synthetase alpha chain
VSQELSKSAVEQALSASLELVSAAADLASLKAVKSQVVGEGSPLSKLNALIKDLPGDRKAEAGQLVGGARAELNKAFDAKEQLLEAEFQKLALESERIDITASPISIPRGARHPLSLLMDQVSDVFIGMGWEIADGPELENEWFNFDALNFHPDHPARAMHDTFYFDSGLLLRTHTSPVQIRTMEQQQPPLRIIAPGRVYRCDSDQTHTPMFHQIEGLVVDTEANFAQLKTLLEAFLIHFFDDPDLKVRFRPSYFPFTEPSAEVDIATHLLGGRWVEVLGCGVVHPNVLRHAGIDPEIYTGFAFGLGVERLAMLRFGIPDLRMLFDNDVRFLRQFQA